MNFSNNFQQNSDDFPQLGGQQPGGFNQQQMQMQQQFQQQQQQQQFGFQQQQFPNQYQNVQFVQQQQFGGQPQFVQPQFSAPIQNDIGQAPANFTAPAPATDDKASAAAGSTGETSDANPFAANPFASNFNPSSTDFKVSEFKPKDHNAIDLGDDSGFPGFGDSGMGGAGKKKKKGQAELQEERKKKQEEEDAKKPTKGKPSSFFILDYDPNSNADPNGNHRVPTAEQRVFIYTNYPMSSQEPDMIAKIYELFFLAQQEEADKEAYSKQPRNKKQVGDTEEVRINDLAPNAGGGFGGGNTATKAATATKRQMKIEEKKKQAVQDKKVNAATKVKDKAAEDQKKLAQQSAKVKDVDPSTLGENAIDIDLTKQPASLVFVGHVDAGKSTICGQIVYQMGLVDERTIQQFKEEAKKKGRDSWWLAYIMDNNEEEMEKGKTVDIGRTCFDTNNKAFTIIDAPGHKNYVPNMIQGVAQADYAGLVISARKGEFEAGFQNDGQTREHIQLVKSLGVQKLVIIVNKMDEPTVKWSKKRYDEIQKGILPFLLKTGFKEEDIKWIPISGLTGDNITEKSDSQDWYNGPCLMEIFDELPVEQRDANAPLRFPILDKMKEQKIVAFGKVEQGTLRLGDKLALSPNNTPCQVLSIENFKDEQVKLARPGDAVKVKLSHLTEDMINKGDVLCPRENHMFSSQVLLAEVDLLELRIPVLTKGSTYMMHVHTFADLITIQVIEWAVETDQNGVETRKEKPSMTKSFAKCLVRIQSRNPIPVEKCSDLSALGRFTLRDEGKTIALGRITKFVPFNKESVKKIAVPGQFAKTSADGTTVDKSKNEVYDAETGKVTSAASALGAIPEGNE